MQNSPTSEAPKEEKKQKNWIINWCGAKPEETTGAIEFSVASLFKCLWCTNLDTRDNAQLTEISKSLDDIMKRLNRMENDGQDEDDNFQQPRRRTTATVAGISTMNPMGRMSGIGGIAGLNLNHNVYGGMSDESIEDNGSENIIENTWLEDVVLQRGEVEFVNKEEEEFWNGLLDKYLHPLDDTKDKVILIYLDF